MINWAQRNLQTQWGLERDRPGVARPLTRLMNPTVRDTNRNTVCDRTTFRNRGGGDSCDEFPFATTYQSAPTSLIDRRNRMIIG
jgi:hypothetical protein